MQEQINFNKILQTLGRLYLENTILSEKIEKLENEKKAQQEAKKEV